MRSGMVCLVGLVLFLLMSAVVAGEEIRVFDGEELRVLLGGGAVRGHRLSEGALVFLGGPETVFSLSQPPDDGFCRGCGFLLAAAPDRPRDKATVVVRYTGPGKARLFGDRRGTVRLQRVKLEGWEETEQDYDGTERSFPEPDSGKP